MAKTILEIQIAVQENKPGLTDQELRLCIESLRTITHFLQDRLAGLVDTIRDLPDDISLRLLKFRAETARATLENMRLAEKRSPEEYLGPANIPGSEEQVARLKWAKNIYKLATGEDL